MAQRFFILLFFFSAKILFCQSSNKISDHFTISGLVDNTITLTYEDIAKEKVSEMGNLTIINHLGEYKKEYKNLKGVLLTDLLNKTKISVSSPKLLSEYYFVIKATDGYTVVYSWNELYNTEVGNGVYIVLEADGKEDLVAPEKILMVSLKDFKTGRRHLKWLKTIEVRRA